MPNYISQIDFGDGVVRDITDINEAKTRGALGAKNLLNNTSKTNTANGITFTVNADKSVTMTASNVTAGTSFKVGDTFKLPTGKYILTGAYGGSEFTYKLLLSYGGMQYSETGNELSFTVSSADTEYEVYARVPGEMVGQSISATVYPMIRLATDTDPTYQPYAKTNHQLTGPTDSITPMLNVLGAKNLLKNTASSKTNNGITFTVNNDGSVTANGTATANAWLAVNDSTIELKKGTYIFTALATQGSTSTFDAWTSNWGDGVNHFDRGDGVEFTISSDQSTGFVAIRIYAGQTVSDLTFYPMIRPASIEDSTYVPYTMTNYELTKKVPTLKSATLSAGSTSVTFTGLPTSGDYLIDFYTSTGINYKAIDTATAGQVTLTFDAQSSAVTVYCEIKEV